MRTIKFRVWDGKEYCYSDTLSYIGLSSQSENTQLFSKLAALFHLPISNKNANNCVIQQFTGLLDKNGKEIYEGDIVIYNSSKKEVIWYEPDSAWRLKEDNENVSMSFNGWVKHSSVIGNIYENPELIKS